MVNEFKNPHESKEKSLGEIAKEVNDFLDPIVEKTFSLRFRKNDSLANEENFRKGARAILGRAEDLGLAGVEIIDPKMAKDIKELFIERLKTDKIIEETKPDKFLSLDIVPQLKKIDKDGRLERELQRVYGFDKKIDNWDMFTVLLSMGLQEDPFFWDNLRKKSEQVSR